MASPNLTAVLIRSAWWLILPRSDEPGDAAPILLCGEYGRNGLPLFTNEQGASDYLSWDAGLAERYAPLHVPSRAELLTVLNVVASRGVAEVYLDPEPNREPRQRYSVVALVAELEKLG